MNPFQLFKRNPKLPTEKALRSLLQMLEIITLDLEKYKTYDKPNKYAIAKQENLLTLIQNFIDATQKESALQTEVIKKQALIIQLSGIQYPTIFQSLEHIHEISLVQQGRIEELGEPHPYITVEIPVI